MSGITGEEYPAVPPANGHSGMKGINNLAPDRGLMTLTIGVQEARDILRAERLLVGLPRAA